MNGRFISFIKIGGIALAILTFVSCRQDDKKGSDLKTLDQMASGSGANYSCAVTPVNIPYVKDTAMAHVILDDGNSCLKKTLDKTASTAEAAQCDAMENVLSIIAEKNLPIVQSYFDDSALKGEVKISNAAVEGLCQKVFSDEKNSQYIPEKDRKQIEGCWSIVPVDATKTVTLMVHKADADSIRRNGIRVFGMFYGQAVMQMVKSESGKFQFDPNYSRDDSVRKPVWEKKNELAQTFLLDVRNASKLPNSTYSLDKLPYIKDLPPATKAATKKLIEEAADISSIPIDKLFGADDKSKLSAQRFVDTVVGQAFDSGFCQATQNTTANAVVFKGTMDIFNGSILPDLKDLAKRLGVDPAKVTRASVQSSSGGIPTSSGQSFGLGMDMMSMFGMMMPMLMGGTGQPGMTQGMGMQNPQLMQLQGQLQNDQAQLNQLMAQAQQNPAMVQQNPAMAQQISTLQQRVQMEQSQLAQMGGGSMGTMGMNNPMMMGQQANPMMSMMSMLGPMMANMTRGTSGGNCANGQCGTGGCSGGNCPGATRMS